MAQCDLCAAGPSGIAGHDRLFSQSMTPDLMHFLCRGCGSRWVRRAPAEGGYQGREPAGEHKGYDTPGRPGTAPP
jgi:hypothetical protein